MTHVNWTKQAILAGGLLVLGTAAYWLEYKHKPEQESKEEQNKKLFNLKDVQVKEVLIHDGIGHTFDIHCSDATSTLCKPGENSKWELSQPLKLKADDANANALISTLNNLTFSETIDLKDETPEKRASLLKEYGLDATARALPGTRQIAVATPGGTTVLYLGQTHPIGDSIFGVAETVAAGQKPTGKVNEDKVYLVPTYFKTNFDHDLTYWRDKKLLTASAHEIESFELKDPKAQIQGTRKDGQWTLKTAKEGEFPGDIENIDNLLTAATFLTAKGFASDDKNDAKAKADLKGAKAIVTLTMQQEKGTNKEPPAPIVLTLYQKGAAKPAAKGAKPGAPASNLLYATVSNLDPLYELEPNALDRLNKDVKDLRLAKLITSMERFTAKKITIEGKPLGNPPLVLLDKDGKWSIEGVAHPIANDKVQGLLDKLSGNRIQEFLIGSAIPSGENDGLNVKLADEKGQTKRELAFWKSGGKLYARDLASKRKEAFLVDIAVQDALPWSRDFFDQKEAPPHASAPGAPGVPGMPPGMPAGMPGAPPEPGRPLIPQPPQKK